MDSLPRSSRRAWCSSRCRWDTESWSWCCWCYRRRDVYGCGSSRGIFSGSSRWRRHLVGASAYETDRYRDHGGEGDVFQKFHSWITSIGYFVRQQGAQVQRQKLNAKVHRLGTRKPRARTNFGVILGAPWGSLHIESCSAPYAGGKRKKSEYSARYPKVCRARAFDPRVFEVGLAGGGQRRADGPPQSWIKIRTRFYIDPYLPRLHWV